MAAAGLTLELQKGMEGPPWSGDRKPDRSGAVEVAQILAAVEVARILAAVEVAPTMVDVAHGWAA